MLKNYIKVALKILMRRKYYTFLSLLGISLTIMIITVFGAVLDLVTGPNVVEPYRNRTLEANKIIIYKDGKATERTPSAEFFKRYFKDLHTPERISVCGLNAVFVSNIKNKPRLHILKYTDHEFWNITDYKFIEGRPYGEAEIKNASQVIVITESAKKHIFNDSSAVGKTVYVYGEVFKIIGVVKDGPVLSDTYAEAWAPLSTDDSQHRKEKLLTGNYKALLLTRSPTDFKNVRNELKAKMRKLNTVSPDADSIGVIAISALEKFSKSESSNYEDSKLGKSLVTMLIFLLLFMLIPAISLINLNITRISERYEEIGIRKSFGATSATLVGQFVVENIILTILGSILGVILAFAAADGLISIVNAFDPLMKIAHGQFVLSWRLLIFCITIALVFGILSGIYPAWKMSRVHPVQALKGEHL